MDKRSWWVSEKHISWPYLDSNWVWQFRLGFGFDNPDLLPAVDCNWPSSVLPPAPKSKSDLRTGLTSNWRFKISPQESGLPLKFHKPQPTSHLWGFVHGVGMTSSWASIDPGYALVTAEQLKSAAWFSRCWDTWDYPPAYYSCLTLIAWATFVPFCLISEPNVCWFVRIFMSADGGSYRKENIADYIELWWAHECIGGANQVSSDRGYKDMNWSTDENKLFITPYLFLQIALETKHLNIG